MEPQLEKNPLRYAYLRTTKWMVKLKCYQSSRSQNTITNYCNENTTDPCPGTSRYHKVISRTCKINKLQVDEMEIQRSFARVTCRYYVDIKNQIHRHTRYTLSVCANKTFHSRCPRQISSSLIVLFMCLHRFLSLLAMNTLTYIETFSHFTLLFNNNKLFVFKTFQILK